MFHTQEEGVFQRQTRINGKYNNQIAFKTLQKLLRYKNLFLFTPSQMQ